MSGKGWAWKSPARAEVSRAPAQGRRDGRADVGGTGGVGHFRFDLSGESQQRPTTSVARPEKLVRQPVDLDVKRDGGRRGEKVEKFQLFARQTWAASDMLILAAMEGGANGNVSISAKQSRISS